MCGQSYGVVTTSKVGEYAETVVVTGDKKMYVMQFYTRPYDGNVIYALTNLHKKC